MTPTSRQRRTGPTILPTLVGAATVVTGATALSPLVTGTSWLTPLVELMIVIWLVGVGGRAISAPAGVTVAAQFFAYLFACTALTTTAGIAGIIPGPDAIHEASAMLTAAWDQVMTTAPPMPATAAVTLLVVLCLGAVGLVVDILVGTIRTPALAALPLLGVYAVPASIADTLLPWYSFVLPAIGYALILAAAGAWPVRWHLPTATTWTAATAVVTVVAVGGAMIISGFATGVGTDGRIPHAGRSTHAVHINPWANLRDDLTSHEPTAALRVSGLGSPHYLRTFALNTWVPHEGFSMGHTQADVVGIGGTLPHSATGPQRITATVTALNYHDKYLPMYLDTTAVTGLGPGWNFDSAQHTIFRATNVTPGPYTLTTVAGRLSANQLRADHVRPTDTLTNATDVPQQVRELTLSLTADAPTVFDRVVDVLHYFTDPSNGFTYSLQAPPADSGSALVDFLNAKSGFCEQYAVTMAMMLRSIGIPARVGVGFTQGEEQSDGDFMITSANAHAWVEVRFDHAGWVTFDPTPRVGGQGGIQGFIPEPPPSIDQPQNTGTSTSIETTTDTAATTATTAATSTTVETSEATAIQGPADEGQGSDDTSSSPSWFERHQWTLWAALAAVVLVLLGMAGPAWVRRVRRRKRARRAASGEQRAATAAWDEIIDTLVDHAVDVPTTDTARVVAEQITSAVALDPGTEHELHQLVTAAEREWYADKWYAGEEARSTQDDGARIMTTIVRAIAHAHPRRWRMKIWPRSLRHHRGARSRSAVFEATTETLFHT